MFFPRLEIILKSEKRRGQIERALLGASENFPLDPGVRRMSCVGGLSMYKTRAISTPSIETEEKIPWAFTAFPIFLRFVAAQRTELKPTFEKGSIMVRRFHSW